MRKLDDRVIKKSLHSGKVRTQSDIFVCYNSIIK